MPLFGHMLTVHNLAILRPIYEGSGDYFLSIGYDAYFLFLNFWATLAGKWVQPPRAPLMVWELKTQQKDGPLTRPFGQNFISKPCFLNFPTLS